MPRVLVIDDSEIFRRSLRTIVAASAEWTICGEAEGAEDGARLASQLAPDAILMDVSMPGMSGLKAIRHVRDLLPDSKIVIASLHDSRQLVESVFREGARAYVVKLTVDSDLIEALNAVMRGEMYTSPAVPKARATGA